MAFVAWAIDAACIYLVGVSGNALESTEGSQLWVALLAKCEGLVRGWTTSNPDNCFMDVVAVVVKEVGLLEAV